MVKVKLNLNLNNLLKWSLKNKVKRTFVEQSHLIIIESNVVQQQKPEELTYLTSRTNKLHETLDQLKRETIKPQTLLDVLNIIDRVTGNIAKDPNNEQFRTLKLTNEKLQQNLFAYPAVFDVLGLIGFQRKNEVLFLDSKDLNTSFLNQAITEIGTLRIITSGNSFEFENIRD